MTDFSPLEDLATPATQLPFRPIRSVRPVHDGTNQSVPPCTRGPPRISRPVVIGPIARRFLEHVDNEHLTHRGILRWFVKTARVGVERGSSVANLGCADGRVSWPLHQYAPDNYISGLDNRSDLLAVARQRRTELLKREDPHERDQVKFIQGTEDAEFLRRYLGFLRFDINHEDPFSQRYDHVPHVRKHPHESRHAPIEAEPVLQNLRGRHNAVVCSLFLDNVELSKFFRVVRELLGKSHRWLLITNIHPDARKLPGFGGCLMMEGTIVPRKFPSIEEIIQEGKKHSFEWRAQGEKTFTEDYASKFGAYAKAWIGTRVWYTIAFEMMEDV